MPRQRREGLRAGHRRPEAARGEPAPLADTSYACVIDEAGNAFSTTPSDGSSGTPVIPGTGLCPSSRGTQSWTDPAHPAVMAPGKRPRLTPNPAMLLRDGKAYMPFGSPGNDIQPQAMVQVLLNVVLWDMDPQAAVEAPRFATYSFPSSSAPHAYHPGRLNVSRIDSAVVKGLAALGHDVKPWPEIEWRAGAVMRDTGESRRRAARRWCGSAPAGLRVGGVNSLLRSARFPRSRPVAVLRRAILPGRYASSSRRREWSADV
jgi:gamma-glutamyltranspeptidase